MADVVSLTLGGQRFNGWKRVEINRSMDAVCATFALELTDRWQGNPEHWDIEAGAPCEVLIDDDLVITGYLDEAVYAVDGAARTITVTGRDRTADLIDCSALHKPGSWKGRRLEQIAAELAAPFGVVVRASASTGSVFPSVALQQGETVFEVISRLARERGFLLVTTPEGELLLTRPGGTAAGYNLVLGENAEAITFRNSVANRFSDYVLKGYGEGGSPSAPKGSAKDIGVLRYRPLLIVNDGQSTSASLTARAKWEASVRAGKAQTAEVTVSGWRARNGQLYATDRLVPVSAALAGVDDTLLISGVSFVLDADGSRTRLSLTRKEAFSLEPVSAPRRRKTGAAAPLTGGAL